MNMSDNFEIIDGLLVKYHGDSMRVVVPDSVTSIGEDAFFDCYNIENIVLPYGIKSIGDRAFKFCENIKDIVLPESVSYIGDEAFFACSWLNSVSLPDSVVSICNNAFSCCGRLSEITCYKTSNPDKNYKSIDGVLYTADEKTLVFYPQGKPGGRFIVPECVEHIGEFSILRNTRLSYIALPSGVKSIGKGAFNGCVELTSVVLPESIKYIHPDSFINCPKILGFEISDSNKYYKTLDDSLYTKDGKSLICYAAGYGDAEFVIPQGVTSINQCTFLDCKFQNVVIPTSVTSIGNRAFGDCSMLLTITIPESVTDIGELVFEFCENLTIRTPKGSCAEKYANENGIEVEYTDS